MPKRTSDFREDLLSDLASPIEAAHYLNAALEDSDEMFLVALRDVAEARKLAKVAEAAGIARESIYRTLAPKGNPTYGTLMGILHAVGLRLIVSAGSTQARITSPESSTLSADPGWNSANKSPEEPVPTGEWRKPMGMAAASLPFHNQFCPAGEMKQNANQ